MKRISSFVRNKAARIKLLLLDVDGVLTDGRIIIDDNGIETKQFDVRDGQGISLLMRAGIDVGFITGRTSRVVDHRARDLGVRLVFQGISDKLSCYDEIKRQLALKDNQIAFVGDDMVDLPVLSRVGLSLSVSDGWPELSGAVDYITAAPGGHGAVREVAELLLKSQGKWPKLTSS